MPVVNIPGVGNVVLVDREQLRFKSHGRRLAIPYNLLGLIKEIPPAPATFDWSKGESLKFPILGNDQYGDCYYAAVAHGSQCFTGNAGSEFSFDVNALTKRYLTIAGGDNGLDDSTIMPEWKTGIVGPNGPRKILDEITVPLTDEKAIDLAMWAFCGLIWTCDLLNSWLNNTSPGSTWDAGGGKSGGGHAMYLTGKNSKRGSDIRTWGISPPINLTHAGLLAADSELIAAFSLDMFTPDGIAPCGANYQQLAALWQQLGGQQLPPDPFPPSQPVDWWA